MKELLLNQEYTGQEIIDWIAQNPKDPMSIEIARKYYQLDDWFDVICFNPSRKYTIRSYSINWYDDRNSNYPYITYKVERVPIKQPRRSSLKRV